MSLLLVVAIHVKLVSLIPLLGLFQEAGLLIHNVLSENKWLFNNCPCYMTIQLLSLHSTTDISNQVCTLLL